MADFLSGFVKTVMNDIVCEDYPHIQHPTLLYAQVKETAPCKKGLYATLQVLTENKEEDRSFPLIPYVKSELDLQAGNIVIIGLLYGGCIPYIFGRCLDDID